MDALRSQVKHERRRVRQHLAGAERAAHGRRHGLNALQSLNRALLLDELARYRQRGHFPINRDFSRGAVPVFVDEFGTPCAVGHLLEVSGQGELVRRIARTRNNAPIRELAALAELRAWLTAAGLTVEEAARIQPSYCFLSEAEACFCSRGSSELPVAVGTIVTAVPASTRSSVRIDRIEGDLNGIRVGDEVPVMATGLLGEQVLLSPLEPDGTLLSLASARAELPVRNGQVYCQLNPDTAARPVSIDTAIEALRNETAACIGVLANDDSLWNRSQCEGGSGLDGVAMAGPSEADPDSGGCGVAQTAGPGGVELTSAALLAILVARRRRPR